MRRSSILALLGLVLLGCSGGSGNVTELRARCPGGASFCLVSCNLGCVGGGCTVSEIAQNQPVVLEFSKNVDLASVDPATLSIRTASGESPAGTIAVDRHKITFTPEIRVSAGGGTLFGFQAGKEYQIALPGGPGSSQSIRSVSGDPLNQSVICILRVSQGIVDLDQTPPQFDLIAPIEDSIDVPRQATIVLRFGELIDISPFQGTSTEFSPIRYELRRPLRDPNGALLRDPDTGLPLGDPAFTPVRIEGVPRADVNPVTREVTVSLTPVIPLPTETWVEVTVTDQVRDLSGTQAVKDVMRFFTVFELPGINSVTEDFERGSNLDTATSSGTWGGFRAVAGAIGGDGRHGSFNQQRFGLIGVQPPEAGPGLRQWDTDHTVIPAEMTVSGQDETVTDGRYYFTDFVLDQGRTIEFVGSKPALIFVRGTVDIAGKITSNGTTIDDFSARPSTVSAPIAGQRGGDPDEKTLGRLGGGSGGSGADSGDGFGHQPRFDGQDGEDVQLPAGHAYLSRAVGTGGRGSPQYPPSGHTLDITFNALVGSKSGMLGAGGGGGGFFAPGGPGVAVLTPGLESDLGPVQDGGLAINLFDAEGGLPPGTSSLEHFAVGGSGGGGGGSHPFLTSRVSPDPPEPGELPPGRAWKAGVAGAPGGGVLVVRAGGSIHIQRSGILEARGGNGRRFDDSAKGLGMPGGGGSGGSILLQSGRESGIEQEGLLDTSGGGGSLTVSTIFFTIVGLTVGGDGSPGFIRLETAGGTPDPGDTVPEALGAGSFGTLTDTDTTVGAQSRWYSTRSFFPPEFLRYEVVAEIDGQEVLFSDDPSVSAVAADDPTAPILVLFQAAPVNFTTREPVTEKIGPWRKYVHDLNADPDVTGFRFSLTFNRGMTSDIVVKRVSVFFRS